VEHEGGLSRIGNSFGAAIFGIVLFLGSFPLLWWNEGRAVDRMRDLEEGQSAAVAVQSGAVDGANEGKLVHTSGEATTDEELSDPALGVQTIGLRLRRTVEMYQWEEEKKTKSRKKVGGGKKKTTTYTYDKVWSDDLIDSSGFKVSEGHQNPASMPIRSQRWNAETVTLGAFTLSPSLVAEIDAWKPVAISAAQAAAAKIDGGRPVQQQGDGLYVGANPGAPDIGDLRVTFQMVPATVVSVISGQSGSSFQPWTTSRGGTVEELALGTKTMEQMFQAAHDANTMLTWILRLVGFLCMAIGLAMVFSPLTAVADVIPFVGSIVGAGVALFAGLVSIAMSSLTIGLAWLFYRPLIGIPMLCITGICIFLVMKAGKARKAAAG
jgi:hypothetical protein